MSPSKQRRDEHRASAWRHFLNGAKGHASLASPCPQRSVASQRSSRNRRAQWIAWRSDRFSWVPKDRLWLLDRLGCAATAGTGSFGSFITSFAPEPGRMRLRDVFPIAPVAGVGHKPVSMTTVRWHVLLRFINVVLVSLNWLYGVKRSAAVPQAHTASQRTVVDSIVERSLSVLHRLQEVVDGEWERFLPDFVDIRGQKQPASTAFQDLVAERVDNLEFAAQCDPLPHLPAEVQSCLQKGIIESPPPGLHLFESFSRGSREEYAKLVIRQVRCGKLGLSTHCCGGGTSFAVGKHGGQRLREVWHGRRVSEAAARPPKPRHLASPTALTFLECSDARPFRLSKRDASCWFDQLRLPAHLRLYMAKPPLSTAELREAGMTDKEQQLHLEEGQLWREGPLFPLHHVWPMGFSWSSYIAQEEMLHVCREAGLDESVLLACDCTTPSSFELVAAVATDDVMLFSNVGEGTTLAAAQVLDAVIDARGAVRNAKKDVNDELCGTCVGVDLVNGCFLDVPGPRYLAMIMTFLHLHACRVASPQQVQQLLGMVQWYDLLVRPKLSVYSSIYAFTLSDDESERSLPGSILGELACSLCLGIFWRL
ncbi:PDE9A [Symbiodinium sp. CCMP2592]|nr:PDE9A [Symbiodinium sp. CCMP2592]